MGKLCEVLVGIVVVASKLTVREASLKSCAWCERYAIRMKLGELLPWWQITIGFSVAWARVYTRG